MHSETAVTIRSGLNRESRFHITDTLANDIVRLYFNIFPLEKPKKEDQGHNYNYSMFYLSIIELISLRCLFST